jgi:hypothetical protein
MKRVDNNELAYIAKTPWLMINPSPIACELMELRRQVGVLERAAWELVEELRDADKQLGAARPAELQQVYKTCARVEDDLLDLRAERNKQLSDDADDGA